MLTILEVELQPQISRKITWVLLALARVSSNNKLALSIAVRDTGSSSKTRENLVGFALGLVRGPVVN